MKHFFFALLTIFTCYNSLSQSTDTSFYSVVNLNKIIGENKSWKTSPTEYHYYFYFNDRGRGQVVNSTVITNAGDKVLSETSNGLDYFKAPFTASFKRNKDSLVSFYNTIQKKQIDTGQQYIFRAVPAGIEIFISALAHSPVHKLITMSGDTATLKSMNAFTVHAGNKTIKLFLVDINYGKGSSPSFTWVDENDHFFADVSGWSATIKKNYENLIDTLHALQETAAIPFYKGIYKQLSDPFPSKMAVKDVTLFDAPNATVIEHSTVLVEEGIIIATGLVSKITIPAGFTIIDGKGRTLLPGLWDTHGHYNKDEGIDYLSGGITHVRDMGNMPEIKQVQENIRLHNLTGPDVSYLSGFIDKDDEYHGPVGKLVNSKKEAVEAVGYYHKAGYNQIKIYSSIDTGWVQAMCTEAHRFGMRVAGHIPVHMTSAVAVKKGFDEITHLNMVMLNFFPDTIDTRKNRFKPVGRSAYTLNLKSRPVKEYIELLKQKHTVVEPTINIFNEMFNSIPGDTTAVFLPVLKWMPEAWRSNVKVNSFIDDTLQIPAYKQSFNRMLQMLKLLYDSHIPLLAGTDGGEQFALHHELELFAQAGIPANEILKIATYNPSKILGLASRYGSVLPGRVADFILVDGSPYTNISDIRRVYMVVTNHSLYYPKKLYKYFDWSYYY